MPLFCVSPRDNGEADHLVFIPSREDEMAAETTREEYTYQIENRVFIVTPVYKEKGEPLRDILLKLMLADIEPR